MPAIPPSGFGWGSSTFGGSGWGGPLSAVLQLTNVIATSENAFQLQFTLPVYLSNLLDIPDASVIDRYAVSAVQISTGYDGETARVVTPVMAAYTLDANLPAGAKSGSCIDLTVDRPMTPYPAVYQVSVNGLFSQDLTVALDTTAALKQAYGLFKSLVQPSLDLPATSRDFANPQAQEGASTAIGFVGSSIPAGLGVFQVDSSGDYTIDNGITALKKRIYRRLLSIPGAFLHLGTSYGVGIPSFGKKLSQAHNLEEIASKCESQISQEPEVQQVKVSMVTDQLSVGLVRVNMAIKVRGGQSAKWSALFRTE